MALGLFTPNILLVLTISIVSIRCNSDSYSILNSEDGHLHESPAYKYSKQSNAEQFNNMSGFSLFKDNIFLSILSINLIPIIIIFFFIPITLLRRYRSLLIILLSFASGGLMADVFLRLLPCINQSYNPSQLRVGDEHDSRPGLFILTGIFLSFIIEKICRYFQDDDQDEHSSSSITNSSNIIAYLFLSADILHNYTNTLTFSSKSTMNSNVIINKVTYEMLHVFYGYAILIHSGWTLGKAMRVQLLTGLSGSIICLMGGQFQSNMTTELWSNQIVLPIIAGIFVYISTVHIIPEVISSNNGYIETIFKVNVFIISVIIILYLKKNE